MEPVITPLNENLKSSFDSRDMKPGAVYFAEFHHYIFQENQIPSLLDYNTHTAHQHWLHYLPCSLARMGKHLLYLCEIAVHWTHLRLVKSLSVSHVTEVSVYTL